MKERSILTHIVAVGLMAALVFVSSLISIPVPSVIGISRIHLGNIFCLLAGFLLGGLRGGLAAGLGSAIYDMTNPAYIAEAPITFINKFLLAFVCGLVYAKLRGEEDDEKSPIFSRAWLSTVVAAICGSLTYVILYLGKAMINDLLFLRTEWETAMIDVGTRAVTSLVNALIAVVVSVPLFRALAPALRRAHLGKFLQVK
jgi:uncharacterized membrane protein